jgi:hypothetical protein
MEIGRELLGDEFGGHAGGDLDTGLAKLSDALTRDPGIGILHADQYSGDPGGDDGLGARGCSTVMRTGFQGDREGASPGAVAGDFESDDLGVAAADRLGRSLSDHRTAGVEHDGSDPRVRSRRDSSPASDLHRERHQGFGVWWPDEGVGSRCGVVHSRVRARGDTPTGTAVTVLLDLLPSGL